MHRLLYTSNAADPVRGVNLAGQAQSIAAQSRERNKMLGISGVLVQIEGQFIQVLEGKLDQLEIVFESICCDFRHRDLRLVDLVPIRERLFGNWEMACISPGEETALDIKVDLQDIRFLVGVNASEAIARLQSLLDPGVPEMSTGHCTAV